MLMTLTVIVVLIINLVWGQIRGIFKFYEKQHAQDQEVSLSDLRQPLRE